MLLQCSPDIKPPGMHVGSGTERAPILQRLMRAVVVVLLLPVSDDPAPLVKRLECVLPDTLFFEASTASFDHPILFQRVRRDELLLQSIVATGLPNLTALEDQSVAAA